VAQNKQIQSWQPDLTGQHPKIAYAFRQVFDAIQDHDTAIVALDKKVTGPAAITPSTSTTVNTNTSTSSIPNLGVVSVQSATTYTLAATDDGSLIVLTGTTMAMALSSSVIVPFFVSILNLGTGNATLTPTVGLVNGAASLTMLPAGWAVLYFDGTSWWSLQSPVLPVTKTLVAHQWLDSYDSTTGDFTQSQPAIADVSGLSTALAATAPIASPTFTGVVTEPDAPVLTAATTTTSATAGTGSALPALPSVYLTVSVNGTSYKLALFLP
jgi:hypothetical protein